MKRNFLFRAIVVACTVFSASIAMADSVAVTSGSGTGTAVLTHAGQVDYISPGTGNNPNLQGSILTKALLAGVTQDITYNYDVFDYTNNGGGIRLSEIITTDTPVSYYIVEIADPSSFFTFADVPGQAVITFPGGNDPLVTIVPPPAGASVTLSADKQTITFAFAAPTSSFGVHIPVENLSGQPGSFSLSQTAVVPLPAAVWAGMSLMGLMGAQGVRRKRQKQETELA